MLRGLFRKKQNPRVGQILVAQLNARLQPMHRGELFEDPLDVALKAGTHGAVSGGGTLQAESGEVEYCKLEIEVPSASTATIQFIVAVLEQLGAPKGSKLMVLATGEEVSFGTTEGMAVYLNGNDLPQTTYQECDSNHVYSEFARLLKGEGRVLSYWQGPTETAFYLYGRSFEEMKKRLSEFVRTYPLCERCRMKRIA